MIIDQGLINNRRLDMIIDQVLINDRRIGEKKILFSSYREYNNVLQTR